MSKEIDWDKPDYSNGISEIFSDDNYIYKKQPAEMAKREYQFLCMIEKYGYAPKADLIAPDCVRLKKITSESVTNETTFMTYYDKIIEILSKENIRHGDLTPANIIVNKNKPNLIDFNESRLLDEPSDSDKRPEDDSYHLLKTMIYYIDKAKYPDAINIRAPKMWWHIKKALPKKNCKTVFDLGAGTGDISVRFLKEGLSVGVVENKEEQLAIFSKTYQSITTTDMTLYATSILSFIKENRKADIMCCFSVLPYFSEDERKEILKYMADNSKVSFIEIQLEGDGPGYIKDNGHIMKIMDEAGFNKVKQIGVTLVEGRNIERRIWRCSK